MFLALLRHGACELYRSHAEELLPEVSSIALECVCTDEPAEEGEIPDDDAGNKVKTSGLVLSKPEPVTQAFPEALFVMFKENDDERAITLLLKNCRHSKIFSEKILNTLTTLSRGNVLRVNVFRILPEVAHTEEMAIKAYNWCKERIEYDKRSRNVIVGIRATTILANKFPCLTWSNLELLQNTVSFHERDKIQTEVLRLIGFILRSDCTSFVFIKIEMLASCLRNNISNNTVAEAYCDILIAALKMTDDPEKLLTDFGDIYESYCINCDHIHLIAIGLNVAAAYLPSGKHSAQTFLLAFLKSLLERLVGKNEFQGAVSILRMLATHGVEFEQIHGCVVKALVDRIALAKSNSDIVADSRLLAVLTKYAPALVQRNMKELLSALRNAGSVQNVFIVVVYFRCHFLSGTTFNPNDFTTISNAWQNTEDPVWIYKIILLSLRHGFPDVSSFFASILQNMISRLNPNMLNSERFLAIQHLSHINWEISEVCGLVELDKIKQCQKAIHNKLIYCSDFIGTILHSFSKTEAIYKMFFLKSKLWLCVAESLNQASIKFPLQDFLMLLSQLLELSNTGRKNFQEYLVLSNQKLYSRIFNPEEKATNPLNLSDMLVLTRLEALTNISI